MKKIISVLSGLLLTFVFVTTVSAESTWEITAPSTIDFVCGGGDYLHTLNTVTNDSGDLTGTGWYNPDNSYTWDMVGGVSLNNVSFAITYTGTGAGAVYNLTGTISPDGSISGTVDSNCETFTMPAGTAILGTNNCSTIEDGTITDVNGNIIGLGYDEWGYNYQAHMFNGFASNYSRPPEPDTTGDKLIMKWSDPWLSNLDCDGNGKLDRGLVDGQLTDGISKGWLTNHYTGTITVNGKDKKYTDFIKIGWVGPGGRLWGQYTILQEIWNDKSQDLHGLYSILEDHGFGLNEQWTSTL